jgi:hypothetical protein
VSVWRLSTIETVVGRYREEIMVCRECGDEVRELYSCRLCDGNGLCAVCANLCRDYSLDNEWTESAENEPTEENWPEEGGDEQCADKFAQRDESQLVKPQPKSVVYDFWKV